MKFFLKYNPSQRDNKSTKFKIGMIKNYEFRTLD